MTVENAVNSNPGRYLEVISPPFWLYVLGNILNIIPVLLVVIFGLDAVKTSSRLKVIGIFKTTKQ